MAIGERIRFIRNLRGMTQRWLGIAVGFDEKTADVRVAQYESGVRTPKDKITDDFARVLDVSPKALNLPDIDSDVGLAHTLFALEDLYGLYISSIDGEQCLRLDKTKGRIYQSMFDLFKAWQKEAEKLRNGEITREEYNQWRYKYPELDTTRRWAKVPSQKLSDDLISALHKD